MPITVLNGPVIAKGESLSDPLDLDGGKPVRLTTPSGFPIANDPASGWPGPNITFRISSDGVAWFDLWMHGEEVTLACGPARGIVIMNDFPSVEWLQIRSGTAASPVRQLERREFAIAVYKP
jgi:hypothetical protein